MATQAEPSSSAFQSIISASSNVTHHLNPFAPDFPLALPSFLANAASFAFITVPERIDSMLHGGGSQIAEATGNSSKNIISAALSYGGAAVQASRTAATSVANEAMAEEQGDPSSLGFLTFQQVRNFGGVFMYMTSKWALCCFILVSLHRATCRYRSHWYDVLTASTRPSYSIERRSMPPLDDTLGLRGHCAWLYA